MKQFELIQNTKGKWFTAIVQTKKGERKFLARTGVRKYLRGGEPSYDRGRKNHICVFDLYAKWYRTINVNELLYFKCGKIVWTKVKEQD